MCTYYSAPILLLAHSGTPNKAFFAALTTLHDEDMLQQKPRTRDRAYTSSHNALTKLERQPQRVQELRKKLPYK